MTSLPNYIKVSENIATSGQPSKAAFKIIAKNKFDVVINLAMHNRGALKEEDKIVSKNGMMYIHIPITWEAPELERLELFLHLLKTLQDEKKKVFIHCIMNYRASVFIYHYKKAILKQTDAQLIAPKAFQPNKIWKKILNAKLNLSGNKSRNVEEPS